MRRATSAFPTLLLAVCALGRAAPRAQQLLEPGQPIEVEFAAGADTSAQYRVRVPSWATGLELRTQGASIDVQIAASFERDPDEDEDALFSDSLWLDDVLLIERGDAQPLCPGDWRVRLHAFAGHPSGARSGAQRCRLEARLILPQAQPLALGQRAQATLMRGDGLRAVYELAWPRGAAPEGAIVEALCPVADIDLLLGPAEREQTLAHPLAIADGPLGYERLEIAADAPAQLRLHVWAHADLEGLERLPIELCVRARGASEPTVMPRVPAAVPPLAGPLGRALAATVAVHGPLGSGSGVLVSPRGHVLTNAHVLTGARGAEAGDLVLGFTLDARRPALPCARLELLALRADLDLALLCVHAGLDGSPLPAERAWSWLDVDAAPEPVLGAALWVAGYPMTGGSGSMVPLSLTRGIHAGFGLERQGLMLKTDAAIHAGVSGGACLDELGRLIGIPCSSIADSNQAGGLGFVIPLANLPVEWRVRLRESSSLPASRAASPGAAAAGDGQAPR